MRKSQLLINIIEYLETSRSRLLLINIIRKLLIYMFCFKFFRVVFRPIYNFQREIIYNYNPYKINTKKKALLYNKTDWYGIIGEKKVVPGTTQYGCSEQARILNKLGYLVTIVNRGVKRKIDNDYDIYIGLCIGGSGKYFDYYLKRLSNAKIKVAISPGQNPLITKDKVMERSGYFFERHGRLIDFMDRSTNNPNELQTSLKMCDAIFYHGHDYTFKSYSDIDIKKFRIVSPIRENIQVSIGQLKNKYKTKDSFLFYAGSGMLHKGLDVVIEAFIKNPELTLFIATLTEEKIFTDFYNLSDIKNIHYLYSIKSDSKKMKDICGKCGFIISASCWDADPVSIAEGMRYGLVPIVTCETDNDNRYSIVMDDYNVETISQAIKKASKLPTDEFNYLSKNNYIISLFNSPYQHAISLEKAFCELLL